MTALAPTALLRRASASTVRDGAIAAPLGARLQVARAALIVACVLTTSLLLELLLVSSLQQRSAQQHLFDEFRGDLASGTAPIVAQDTARRPGSPVAYLEVPTIGLRQVVVEGTAGTQLLKGPGHRRDTVYPGQAGTSVVMGRRAAFGGPFADIDGLPKGALIRATTGAGVFEYKVRGVRRSGDKAPPDPSGGAGRLVLVSASGAPYVPSGVLLVDADLVGEGLGGAPSVVSTKALPSAERVLSIDTSSLWRLLLWLQALLVLSLLAVWSWHRWHPLKTWMTFLPALMLVGLFTAAELTRLLPNLL